MTGEAKIGDSGNNNDFSSLLITRREAIDGNSKKQSSDVCIRVKLWELEEERKGTNNMMEKQPVWKNIC